MENRLLILGDTAAGYDWQSRMPQFEVSNCAVPGQTTGALLGTLDELKQSHPVADFTMVAAGSSDRAAGVHNFQNNILEIGRKLLTDRPVSDLLLVSRPPITLQGGSFDELEAINRHIAESARLLGSIYMDIFTPMCRAQEKGQVMFDSSGAVSQEGYTVWVKILLEHLAYLAEEDE